MKYFREFLLVAGYGIFVVLAVVGLMVLTFINDPCSAKSSEACPRFTSFPVDAYVFLAALAPIALGAWYAVFRKKPYKFWVWLIFIPIIYIITS